MRLALAGTDVIGDEYRWRIGAQDNLKAIQKSALTIILLDKKDKHDRQDNLRMLNDDAIDKK